MLHLLDVICFSNIEDTPIKIVWRLWQVEEQPTVSGIGSCWRTYIFYVSLRHTVRIPQRFRRARLAPATNFPVQLLLNHT
jgi:hypothetical protein